MKFEIGDIVQVRDDSGLICWYDEKGVVSERVPIIGTNFTVEMNDLKIPMRRIVRPCFNKGYMADLSIVDDDGNRYFTRSDFCKKVNLVTFAKAIEDMDNDSWAVYKHGDSYYKITCFLYKGGCIDFKHTPANMVFTGWIKRQLESDKKEWEKVR